LSKLCFEIRYIRNNAKSNTQILEMTDKIVDALDKREVQSALRGIEELCEIDEHMGIGVDLYPKRQRFEVLGVGCIFVGEHPNGVEGLSEDIFFMQRVIGKLKTNAVKEGLGAFSIDIPIHIPLSNKWPLGDNKEDALLAFYENSSQTLTVLPDKVSSEEDLIASIGHEYGHFLYENRIGEEQARMWESFYRSSLTNLDLQRIWELRQDFSDDEELELVVQSQLPTTWFQVHSLFYNEALKDLGIFDVRSLCECFRRDLLKGRAVVTVEREPITQYSISSAQEAFCEALGLILAQDYRDVGHITETEGPRKLTFTQKAKVRALLGIV